MKGMITFSNSIEGVNNAHWIDNLNGTMSCSNCRTWFYKDDRYNYMLYCPFCNVKMTKRLAESEDKNKDNDNDWRDDPNVFKNYLDKVIDPIIKQLQEEDKKEDIEE